MGMNIAEKTEKLFRLLQMQERLSKGEAIVKSYAIKAFGIPAKTFQRDIESLRQYYSEKHGSDLIYDKKKQMLSSEGPSGKTDEAGNFCHMQNIDREPGLQP
jgi:predicted DNA-binding transcriptional regulator YafY